MKKKRENEKIKEKRKEYLCHIWLFHTTLCVVYSPFFFFIAFLLLFFFIFGSLSSSLASLHFARFLPRNCSFTRIPPHLHAYTSSHATLCLPSMYIYLCIYIYIFYSFITINLRLTRIQQGLSLTRLNVRSIFPLALTPRAEYYVCGCVCVLCACPISSLSAVLF